MIKLYYYYNDSCGCCKGYRETVDEVTRELKLDSSYINIDTGLHSHDIQGIPTIVLEKDGRTIYKSIGNLPYEYLITEIKKSMSNDQ